MLDLGRTPLANALLSLEGTVQVQNYPLLVVRCSQCSLVQLSHVVAPEALFSNYTYFSSYSETMLHHAKSLVDRLIAAEGLDASAFVVEIASNDGYLLRYVREAGLPALGIEPAHNIAKVARALGVETLERFFGASLAGELVACGRTARVIIASNVLAHAPDLNDFMEGIRILLEPDGVFVFEVPYLKDLLGNVEFDTMYHEHQCYFSLTALSYLCQANGLDMVDAERVSIHGGSLRVSVAHRNMREQQMRVALLLAEERVWGVSEDAPYAAFRQHVADLRLSLRKLLASLQAKGARLAAYGAAAKGVTLLSYCGLGRSQLEFIVDRSPHKQRGRYPIDGLPILPPQALLERQPDYTLLLTWNFADEIIEQQREYLNAGGRFIVPLPEPRILGLPGSEEFSNSGV